MIRFANMPMKGWTLFDLTDTDAHCDYCGTKIRWAHHMRHAKVVHQLVVGNECVKSFIDAGDADAALKFARQEWTQRRSYYYKRAHDRVFVIGQNKSKRWWVAYAPSIQAATRFWTFSKHKYAIADAARQEITRLICRGYAQVVARCPLVEVE